MKTVAVSTVTRKAQVPRSSRWEAPLLTVQLLLGLPWLALSWEGGVRRMDPRAHRQRDAFSTACMSFACVTCKGARAESGLLGRVGRRCGH